MRWRLMSGVAGGGRSDFVVGQEGFEREGESSRIECNDVDVLSMETTALHFSGFYEQKMTFQLVIWILA